MTLVHFVFRVFLTFSLLSLSTMAGCGHVSGNFPDDSGKQQLLPEKFKSPLGHDTTLIWVEKGQVHGFLSFWRDTSEHADFFRGLARDSGLEVHREAARMYDDLSAEGIAEMTLFVFFSRGVSVTCKTGDFEIHFKDGSTVRDSGILRYEPRDVDKPYRYTREGPITLSDEPVGKKEPLPVIIFVPAEHLGKSVESIGFLRKF